MNDDETTDTKANKRPARFLLQMPDDLRFMLHRESVANGRSLTSEINMRLKASLKASGIAPAAVAGLLPKAYADLASRTVVLDEAQVSPPAVSDDLENALLEAFRALPPEKRIALVAVLK